MREKNQSVIESVIDLYYFRQSSMPTPKKIKKISINQSWNSGNCFNSSYVFSGWNSDHALTIRVLDGSLKHYLVSEYLK